MGVTIGAFGKFSDGREVNLYTMENKNGMRVSVANIGAALVGWRSRTGRGGWRMWCWALTGRRTIW